MEENLTSEQTQYSCVIKCPHCGAEYLFEEIFMADDIVGTRHAIKDEKGKIVFVEGDEPELLEEYVCDYCDKHFQVVANIVYYTNYTSEDTSWDDDYSVEIYKDRIELPE